MKNAGIRLISSGCLTYTFIFQKFKKILSDFGPELHLISGSCFYLLILTVCRKRIEHNENSEDNPAYVVTTSGTTGQPKIVEVPDHCIISNIKDLR